MASLIADISDAVTVELNAASFSQEFTAVRSWLVDWTLEQLAELRVAVTLGASTWSALTRGRDDVRHAVDVIVQQRINPTDNSVVDPLVELLEEVVDHFRAKSLAAGAKTIVCLERGLVPSNAAAVSQALLNNPHLFTGVIRLSWIVK